MPAQRCAPAYRATHATDVLVRQSVFSAGVPSERQAANDDIRSNILESPGYFVADIK